MAIAHYKLTWRGRVALCVLKFAAVCAWCGAERLGSAIVDRVMLEFDRHWRKWLVNDRAEKK